MYLNIDYIQKQTPKDILNLLTSDKTTTFDMDVINDIILEVENEINGYILASNYILSEIIANPPYMLRRIALKLFKYYAVSRKTIDSNILEPLGRDIADARDMLNKVVSGEILLEGFTKSNTLMDRSLKPLTEYDDTRFNNDAFKMGLY